MKRILRYGKCFALSKIQIQFGQRPLHIAIQRAISRAKAGFAVQQENAVTNGALFSSNPQGHGQKTLLCVQTHAQALAHPGRGRANGVLALLLLAVSMSIQARPLTRQAIPSEGLSGRQAGIKPLQIGDAIPEELWNTPLQVANHPEGKETITLEAYRGKTILLDFLSTGCSGCIKAIPKLEAIGLEFGDSVSILPVTPEKRDRVASFIPANSYVKGTRLPFVVEDRLLKQYFPHLYISHVVWIDAQGVVRATTGTNHVTASTVSEFQSGKALDWPVKTENTPFFNAPLVTLNAEANALPHNTNRPLYYTVITGYTEGIGPYVATEADSLMGIRRVSYRNRSILDLYYIAIGREFPPTRIIWEVSDPARYAEWKADLTAITRSQWARRHALCYERTFPLGASLETIRKQMLADLDAHLNLHGRTEIRNNETYFILSEI
ncbi:Thiol-disulfide isomerase or thioredoxin [Parapedobacter luteus]|uniref:Thiol-disulfide isomerase or thioredoxin n=1 Tax=Parapedobacter luteus TaxID=623280 RepID=A0A1T5CTX4_9SPHI|nr:redoxin domain-containing protein [Parapedobacter luteus]SKB62783.1 Thiol-disulfide isomerase or thioredoxin [Parapedobacter luteus]